MASASSTDSDPFMSAARRLADMTMASRVRLEGAALRADEVADLKASGLLPAALPAVQGGSGDITNLLRVIAMGSLPLARLFEGHLQAVRLVFSYGSALQKAKVREDVENRLLYGVRNTGHGRSQGMHPHAMFVDRPLMAEADEEGTVRMVLDPGEPAGESDPEELTVGSPGDFNQVVPVSREAYCAAAVRLGGVERLLAELRLDQVKDEDIDDPKRMASLAEAAAAVDNARFWLERAAAADDGRFPEAQLVSAVHVARLAVDKAAVSVLDETRRVLKAAENRSDRVGGLARGFEETYALQAHFAAARGS
jgi:hypothetical protein